MQQYQRILVAMDGSKESEAALNRAIQMVNGQDQAIITLANVIDPKAFESVSSFDNNMVDAMADQARQSMEKYRKQATDAGVKNVDYTIEFGSPKSKIARDLPKELNADLIIMGASGLNAVERFVEGSVTSYVSRVAQIDVLIVR
ncbi:universal stress protein [Eupransor demetentiae]|uniref:UspA family (UspA) n=1 Tax=Eupransor demetentiae TaxID=3109584 RepID=A0ABP0ET69_9LACO|nr:Nucleotide-binding universal stress protein [Lactobacillaceae bacterium LMG 33000]